MKKFDQINIIPFVDIMLVLLAIILMTTSFISKDKIKVNIPNSDSTIKLDSTNIVGLITVKETGEIYKNNNKVTLKQLDNELDNWNKNKNITLKIDSNTKFQLFINITDLLNKHELKKLSVVTLQRKNM